MRPRLQVKRGLFFGVRRSLRLLVSAKLVQVNLAPAFNIASDDRVV